jgi:hypothetical protein
LPENYGVILLKDKEKEIKKNMRKKEKIHWKVPFDEDQSIKSTKKGLKEIGWDKSFEESWKGFKETLHCEKADRGAKKAKKFKLEELAKDQEELEEEYHKSSLKHYKKALEYLKEANEKADKKKKEKFREFTKDKEEFKKFKDKLNEVATVYFVAKDLEPEESDELHQILNEELDVLEKEGYDGFVKHNEKKLQDLIEIRSDKTRNRGREHRSPIYWWKWFVIGFWINNMVGILIGCYYTGQWDSIFSILMGLVDKIITLINEPIGNLVGLALDVINFGPIDFIAEAFTFCWECLIAAIKTGC